MNLRVARRLARRAIRHDPPTRRGRLALRRLERAVRRGRLAPVTAVWEVWLDRPAPILWELLTQWGRGSASDADAVPWLLRGVALGQLPYPSDRRFGEVIAVALAKGDHPVTQTAGELILTAPADTVDAVCAAAATDPTGTVARFCVEHRLTPSDPLARTLFLLRTGQIDRYRDTDPHGHLLCAGYAGADADEQRRLRQAIFDAGDVDLPAVVAGEGRARVASLVPDELDDLAGWLTARRDWAGLWRLAGEVSPAAAVDLARAFPEAWRPPDPAGHRLFEALTATPPEAMTPYTRQLELPAPFRAVVSFAPDGSRVAVFGRSWPNRRGNSSALLTVHALPGGEPLHQHRWRDRLGFDDDVVHLGGGTVVVTGLSPRRFTTGGPPEPLPYSPAGNPFHCRVDQHRTGYVSVDWDRAYLGSYTGAEHPRVVELGEAHGVRAFTVEPDSGQFAVFRPRGLPGTLMLFDRDARLLATRELSEVSEGPSVDLMAFAGPDRLVTAGYSGGLVLWRRADDRLVVEATAPTRGKAFFLRWLPAVRRILIQDQQWRWHHAESLLSARAPIPGGWSSQLWASPDGEWVAGPAEGALVVHRLGMPAGLAALVDRPFAGMRRADLSTVTGEGAAAAVVRAGLEYRFRAEPR